MRIAITGASGYVGSYLMENLDSSFNSIKGIDQRPNGYGGAARYQDTDFTATDVIIHLAGHSSVKMCDEDPEESWENNVNGFKDLLGRLHSNQWLIYASSGSVYGAMANPATEEDVTVDSIKNYDMQKIVGDVLAINSIKQSKNVIGLRFGTVNGVSRNTRFDLMLNAMTKAAIETGEIKVSNPRISRPILFLEDLKNAMQNILERPTSGIYNLASTHVTVEGAANTVAMFTGATINLQTDDAAPYDFKLSTKKFEGAFGDYRQSDMSKVVQELIAETKRTKNA